MIKNREYIGIELNSEYVKLSEDRINNAKFNTEFKKQFIITARLEIATRKPLSKVAAFFSAYQL